MSIVDYVDASVTEEGSFAATHRPLHRLGTVRRLQGVSCRKLARRMDVSVAEILRQEEANDLPLSVLYEWQKVLKVPMAELLAESEYALSQPLKQRAQLVRLMKTALTLLEKADNKATCAMAQTLVDQLIKVMPELRGVTAWNAVGKRRKSDELGVAALRTLSDDVFLNSLE